ncbi:DUF2512 family protein [Bacillus piscicola]|uniref:DUF2512 family protein n=1 Tax=Bacillus piscicola TaxID=1632684 RepID=UPI001F08D55F|nr:DUF2512 family protein [Bacillus piscicola]
MVGLFVKLIVCPLTVIIAWLIFPNVSYTELYQPIIVGFILAAAAHMMEIFLLRNGTFWLSTVVDFFVASFIVYFVSLFQQTQVTIIGAFITGALLTINEIFQHRWLINSGRTKKAPS